MTDNYTPGWYKYIYIQPELQERGMLKSELKARIAANMTHLPEKTISDAVDTIAQTMIDALIAGQSIEIRNFGAFGLRKAPPRRAHNPKTGEKIVTQATQKVYFRTGKGLQERINKSTGLSELGALVK